MAPSSSPPYGFAIPNPSFESGFRIRIPNPNPDPDPFFEFNFRLLLPLPPRQPLRPRTAVPGT
jgi:hypothetical protein